MGLWTPDRGRMEQQVDLVGWHPERLRTGVALTDGDDIYEIIDEHNKLGTMWYKLQNVNPEHPVANWFIKTDLYELAYTKFKPDGGRMERPDGR
jgi:hypothetical protein